MARHRLSALWNRYRSLAKRDSSDPLKETRSFLLACSLPQVFAVLMAVHVSALNGPVRSTQQLVPEGTPFPISSRILIWLTGAQGYLSGSLEAIWLSHFALVMAFSWLALVFFVLWWSKDVFVVTRRWIVLTVGGWIIVSLWILFVLVANGAPYSVPMTVMRNDPSWLPWWWKEMSWQHAVGLLWCMIVVVAMYRVWRRDRKAAAVS